MSTLFDPTPEVPGDRDDTAHDDTFQDDTRSQPVTQPVSEPVTEARRPSIPHLVIGLIFLGVAALWALAASGAVSSDDTWLLPGVLIVAGATGLVAALAGSRRGTR